MAKISKEAREARMMELNGYIWQIFMTEGWKAVTYNSIAQMAYPELSPQQAMRKKSSVQSYYPSNKHFGLALAGKVFGRIAEATAVCTTKESFVSTMSTQIKNDQIIRQGIIMLLDNALEDEKSPKAKAGLLKLIDLAETLTGQGREAVEETLGIAVVRLALDEV